MKHFSKTVIQPIGLKPDMHKPKKDPSISNVVEFPSYHERTRSRKFDDLEIVQEEVKFDTAAFFEDDIFDHILSEVEYQEESDVDYEYLLPNNDPFYD